VRVCGIENIQKLLLGDEKQLTELKKSFSVNSFQNINNKTINEQILIEQQQYYYLIHT